jgi:hypothetical protein
MEQDEFLLKEYELCFEQQRFYDTRQATTLKFLFSLTASVATAQFAILKFVGNASDKYYLTQAFLSVVVFIASVLLVMIMVQNRLYFVYATRQLNAIRAHFLDTQTGKFRDNQLWTSTDFPAVKPHSVHMYQLRGAVFMSSLFAGSTAFAFCAEWTDNNTCAQLIIAVCAVLGVTFVEERWANGYLRRKSAQSADEAVHHKSA